MVRGAVSDQSRRGHGVKIEVFGGEKQRMERRTP